MHSRRRANRFIEDRGAPVTMQYTTGRSGSTVRYAFQSAASEFTAMPAEIEDWTNDTKEMPYGRQTEK
jgi:hypothetical protein